jgi:hypothetical protein
MSTRRPSDQRPHGRTGQRVDLRTLARRARAQVEELTGRPVEGVSGIERDPDGWRVMLEVTELPRIPESTSLMATYEAIVDDEGNLLQYNRSRRYYRNHADEEGA